jgi:DNA-binding LytR/AlgR family response regulator
MRIAGALERPLPPAAAFGAAALLVAGGAVYCTAYTLLQGEWESPLEGARWALVNLLPWLAAFELGKRIRDGAATPAAGWVGVALLLAAIALASSLLAALVGEGEPLPFDLVRRLPAVLLIAGLLAIAPATRAAAIRAQGGACDLPYLPAQIDWIRSAGNYVEIRNHAGIALRRMTMRRAEALLGDQGFVRVHRTLLVNSARIEAVRRGKLYDEIRVDGAWLRVGGAYRHLFRHFVPPA